MRLAQPASTISGITLRNQSCAAIVFEGFETLSAVGIAIEDFHGVAAVLAGYPVGVPAAGKCGLSSVGPSIANETQSSNTEIAGMMSWIDSSISFAPPPPPPLQAGTTIASVAFATNKSLLLKNVWIKGTSMLAHFPHSDVAAATPLLSQWSHVKLYAHGEANPSTSSQPKPFEIEMPSYINGQRFGTGVDAVSDIVAAAPGTGPPLQLTVQHTWGDAAAFPSFEQLGARNVRAAPYFAAGNGIDDDTAALQQALNDAAASIRTQAKGVIAAGSNVVFLPRGHYAITSTLNVPPGVALVGVAKHLTVVLPLHESGLDAEPLLRRSDGVTKPMVLVEGYGADAGAGASASAGASAGSVVAFLSIVVWNTASNTSALHWHAEGGMQRQLHMHRANRCGSFPGEGCSPAVPINHPMMLISGRGASAQVFTFFLEDCCRDAVYPWQPNAFWDGYLSGPQQAKYRHLLVTDGAGPVGFYQLNCEHGTGEAICEFANGTHDVDVYGFKTEGNTAGLWIRDCSNISLYGTGGCGCVGNKTVFPPSFEATAVPTMYRVQRSSNVLLANMMDQAHDLHPPNPIRPNMFDESSCAMESVNMVLVEGSTSSESRFVTQPFDRPVIVIVNQSVVESSSTTHATEENLQVIVAQLDV